MTVQQTSDNDSSSPRRRWGCWVTGFVSVGVLVALGGMFLFITAIFGNVSGVEFSPDLFRRRAYSFYEIPFLKIQITPISQRDATGALEKDITKKRFVQRKTKDPQWDLVYDTKISAASPECDARILCSYLDSMHWQEWTGEPSNAAKAKVLWQEVAKVARRGQYIFVPDIMEQAKAAADAKDLEDKIAALLTREYLRLAQTQQKLGNHKQAVEYFTASLEYDEQNAAALRGRAESYKHLGEAEKSDADLAAADEVPAVNDARKDT